MSRKLFKSKIFSRKIRSKRCDWRREMMSLRMSKMMRNKKIKMKF